MHRTLVGLAVVASVKDTAWKGLLFQICQRSIEKEL